MAKQTSASVAMQLQRFLDDWHYRVLHSSLARTWTRTKTVEVALTILRLHQVPLADEEIASLAAAEEDSLIESVTARVQESGIDMEHLQLQIQLVVQTVCTLRANIENSETDKVVASMEGCENPGLAQLVLKLAVVQAGQEAGDLRKGHASWAQNSEARIARLSSAAGEAERLQRQLLAVSNQLDSFGSRSKEKSKSVLMTAAAGQDKALTAAVLGSWHGDVIKVKSEKHVRDRFEAEIAAAEQKLFKYKERQLNNVRAVLMRKVAESSEGLLHQAWVAMVNNVQEERRERELSAQVQQVSQKLANATAASKENTKQVMTRMSAGSDASLLLLCVQSWTAWLDEYRKDKALEDQVKESERRVHQFLESKKEGAKGVLDRMSAGSDTGLVGMMLQYWIQAHTEEQKARELEDKVNAANGKYGSLNGRQRDTACHVQQRINEQANTNLALQVLGAWVIQAKLDKITHYYTGKIDSKRRQLAGVQQMFTGFAKQLDAGLGSDVDSARRKSDSHRSARRRSDFSAGRGDLSLPSIHQKPLVA